MNQKDLLPDGCMHIFCAYAHADEGLRLELETHLAPLLHSGAITWWTDRHVQPGQAIMVETLREIEAANLFVFLVSADFLAGDYLFFLSKALELHHAGKAKSISVIVRPVDWQGTALRAFQPLPKDGQPVTTWQNRDQAWLDVCTGITQVVASIRKMQHINIDVESGDNIKISGLDGVKDHNSFNTLAYSKQPIDKRKLREAIVRAFSLEEIDVLCADVQQSLQLISETAQINLEIVGGNSKLAKVMNLIAFLDRRGYLDALLVEVRRARPGLI